MLSNNPKRTIFLIALMAALGIFALGIMESSIYFKGNPYNVNNDDLRFCNEQRAIKGETGRVFCMYRVQKVSISSRAERRKQYNNLNYYLLDNASHDDLEKMRSDDSYKPYNYHIYSYYTSDEAKKEKLDDLCNHWDDYMSGKTNIMPETFYIEGRVSPKSFDEYDVTELKKAARNCGFDDSEITSLLIFDAPVSRKSIFVTFISGVALVVLILIGVKSHKRNKGYY